MDRLSFSLFCSFMSVLFAILVIAAVNISLIAIENGYVVAVLFGWSSAITGAALGWIRGK